MRRLLLTGLTALLVLLAMAPAHAADPLGLSRDGEHWSGSLDRPLFDPSVRWVPGDVRTARFFVRNQAEDSGDLEIDLERGERSVLFDTGELVISARAGSGPWSEVAAGDLHHLASSADLPAGVAVPVEVRARIPFSAADATMVLASDLDLRVTLTDAAAGSRGPTADPGGELPNTGSALSWWTAPLALLLFVAGALLLARSRRDDSERDRHHPTPQENLS